MKRSAVCRVNKRPYVFNGCPYVLKHKASCEKHKALCFDGNLRVFRIARIAFMDRRLHPLSVRLYFYRFYIPPQRIGQPVKRKMKW